MRIVKTQKILYNRELRIRFIADNEDADYISRVRKLPDCRWSSHLKSWHTKNIENHILFLNKSFPSSTRFYDITSFPKILVIEEMHAEKRICIRQNESEKFLILNFLNDHELTGFIKNLGAKPYEENQKVWMVRNDPETYNNLSSFLAKANYHINFENTDDEELSSKRVSSSYKKQIEKFREILRFRNYEKRTIDQYVLNVHQYLIWIGKNRRKGIESLVDYVDELSFKRNLSHSYLNQQINSVKAYFHFIHGLEYEKMKVKRPKKEFPIPEVLSRQEAFRILQMISNPKHLALFSILYSTGIKLNETVSIKPGDIDKDNIRIFIRRKNGDPGRYIYITNELLEKIENYRNRCQPKNFLFEGYRGAKCSERSIQKVIKKYVQMAGIHKRVGTQILRHSFAGNQLSDGIEIGEIQRTLGHSSRKSTEMYLKMIEKDKKLNQVKI